MTMSITVFFSYAHEDEVLRDKLANHLSILKRLGTIEAWHDRQILPSTEWDKQINTHLATADIILLLISDDFLASEYCWDVEVEQAMKRHEAGDAHVIPIILRDVDWKGAPFGKLQGLPKNMRPVTLWENVDSAFTDVAKGIRRLAEELALKKANGMRRAVEQIKSIPTESTNSSASDRSANPTSFRQQRVQQEIDSLQATYDLLSKKLHRLRSDLAIQAGSAIAFQLEKEIERAEAERKELEQRLDDLENQFR
jgi:TIR domain